MVSLLALALNLLFFSFSFRLAILVLSFSLSLFFVIHHEMYIFSPSSVVDNLL